MLARNPKTGAPIRIMRSEASLWRSQKTLVWLQDQDASVPWDRFDTLCIGVESITKWRSLGKHVDFFALLDSEQETVDWFLQQESSQVKMMFVTRAFILKMGADKFRSLRLANIICIEEMHMMYPFLGHAWDSTSEDLVLLIGAMMRMAVVAGLPDLFSSLRLETYKRTGFEISVDNRKPKELWFITQYYRPEKVKRAREIKKCLEVNAKCSSLDKIVLLNEKSYASDYPTCDKIQEHVIGKRLTYRLVLEYIAKEVPSNVLCVFANADIYLEDPSWKDLWAIKMEKVFVALLRYDVQEDGSPSKLFGPRNDSQDTWAILSDSVKETQWDWAALDFPFGKAGCDNAITLELLRKRYLIVNPALSIKTHHLHTSQVRTYDTADVVDKPAYMYVDPTGIHDMQPVFDLKEKVVGSVNYGSFDRPVSCLQSKKLETFCKMLERGERYMWSATGKNLFGGESIPLYRFENAFGTPQGLVYGYNNIFIGREEVCKEAWANSHLSPITPALDCERCYMVPCNEKQMKRPEEYMLYNLAKVLALRKRFGPGEFWAPKPAAEPSLLELFKWKENRLPVVPYSSSMQIWSKEIYQYPYLAKDEIHKEDIEVLRENLRVSWESTVTTNRWVVMIDGKLITTDLVRKLEAAMPEYEWSVVYEDRTSLDRILQKLCGACGFLFFGGSSSISRWGLSWSLPKGATVIEVQQELDPFGEAAHVSAAAGLQHSFVIVPRASDAVTQEMILNDIRPTIQGSLVIGPLDSTKPILRMPRKSLTGLFAHAGDSFREMAGVWQEKGFVTLVEDPKAVQIWLGDIGDTLLYDRPTLDWLFSAPPEEQTWKFALFGNPTPSDMGGPASSWFFWPRRPKLLETIVEEGVPTKGWEERSKTLVFYGKIENYTQQKRRKQYDWSPVCDDFIMVQGAEKPYPFTHEEYLRKLSEARFGLCIAGFGKKCHREVECMAMGCVPVVTSEVDMECYANPPQEGIHYLRVQTPSEVQEKVAAVSHEAWATMSCACKLWWKENASAEGSWLLTQKLKGMM